MLSKSKKELLAQGFKDLANITAGALVIGQFLTDSRVETGIIIFGFALTALFYTIALMWQPSN